VLAYTIAAEIGDISRFPTPRKLAGDSGLCPRVYQSGERDLRGPLAKQGPRYLRWISWKGPPAAAIASRPRQVGIDEGGPSKMVYAAIDIHKRVFQAAVLDAGSGELAQERLPATREALSDWAMRWQGKLATVALEATTGWRWVARELQARGLDVRLCDPGEARALGGSKRRPKTDRLDAAWLARLLAKEMLPEAWLPPAEIQYLRDRTRLRHALAKDRNRWAQRLHALVTHEGWPCGRGRLLTVSGQQWASALALPAPARASVDAMLAIIRAVDEQIELLDRELRRLARSDRRLQALCAIFGVGPLLAAHILAELGDVKRFRRPRQVVRLSGLDPVVSESADVRRRGRLSKQGSPELRWALAEAAHHACQQRSPDHALYTSAKQRRGTQRATLTVARKIARRAYHILNDLEQAA
jgi:transposase